MMKNQKGFALVILLAFLPVLISAFFLVFTFNGFVEKDLKLKHICRSEGIAGQTKVAPLLSQLLRLNPPALLLKAQFEKAQLELQVAIASENPVAIAKAVARLERILQKRKELDSKQKQIINQSNLLLGNFHAQTKTMIFRELHQGSKAFTLNQTTLQGKAPRLAVEAESFDLAPTYRTVENFSAAQSLSHEWQYQMILMKPLDRFLDGKFKFKKGCAVSLAPDGPGWNPQIVLGAHSLKSVW